MSEEMLVISFFIIILFIYYKYRIEERTYAYEKR